MTELDSREDSENLEFPPLEGFKEAFTGPHYSDAETERIRNEYEQAYRLWSKFPQIQIKTRGMILTMCLNIGIDPEEWREEISKDVPVAREECGLNFWTKDNYELDNRNNDAKQTQYDSIISELQSLYMENIGNQLLRWQKLIQRTANKERIREVAKNMRNVIPKLIPKKRDDQTQSVDLIGFHYNGHDVPRPTENGEIWVFSESMDQYHPLTIHELASDLGPAVYVWDCCHAGLIVEKFFEQQRKNQIPIPGPNFHFAACGRDEFRPIRADIPADIFTQCLVNPVKTAFKWALEKESAKIICPRITTEMINRLPGEKKKRKTLLGELSWILSGLVEAIALDCVVKSQNAKHDLGFFYDCFKSDIVVVGLFHNFILATRIMRSYGCNPVCYPELPHTTHNHPLWRSWDAIVDETLIKLEKKLIPDPQNPNKWIFDDGGLERPYERSCFYRDQLNSFENWIKIPQPRDGNVKNPPLYLPIALQSILEMEPRKTALMLFGKYMDICPSHIYNTLACNLNQKPASYLMRLLSGLSYSLVPHFWMVFIWTKLIAFQNKIDPALLEEKSKNQREEKKRPVEFFFEVIADSKRDSMIRAMSAFIAARTCEERNMQEVLFNYHISEDSNTLLFDKLILICRDDHGPNQGDPLFRKWLLILLGRMWDDYQPCFGHCERNGYIENILDFAQNDFDPEVRAAAIYAIGTYIGCVGMDQSEPNIFRLVEHASAIAKLNKDACFLVRKEIVYSIQLIIVRYYPMMKRDFGKMYKKAVEYTMKNRSEDSNSDSRDRMANRRTSIVPRTPVEPPMILQASILQGPSNLISVIIKTIATLAMDPKTEVRRPACELFDLIFNPRHDDNDPNEHQNSPKTDLNSDQATQYLRRKSQFFKYSAEYWLRTHLAENKSLNIIMHRKKRGNTNSRLNTMSGYSRERTRSRPRERNLNDKDFEFNLAREHNKKVYQRMKGMFRKEEIQSIKRLIHFDRIHEEIKDMTFLPYSNALVASGQTGIYLVDMEHLPLKVDPYRIDDSRDNQRIEGLTSRVSGIPGSNQSDGLKGNADRTQLTSLAIMNQGTDTKIVAVACTDGTVNLRKLLRNQSGRLEIQDKVLTSWMVASRFGSTAARGRQDFKICWNEEHLACSFSIESDCVVSLWDGHQEKQIHQISLRNKQEISSLKIMGTDAVRRGPLLAGCSDGTISLFDPREREIQHKEIISSRRIDKHRITGIETMGDEILVGYSNCTVRLWDIRMPSRDRFCWTGRNRTTSTSSNTSTKSLPSKTQRVKKEKPASSFFTGSLNYDFFLSDNRGRLWASKYDGERTKDIIGDNYPLDKNAYSGTIPIREPETACCHPFTPFVAMVAKNPETTSRGLNDYYGSHNPKLNSDRILSIWIPDR